MKNLLESKKTILFIPETGIYPFVRSLSVLGEAIKRQGDKVYLTHCTGQMIRCPMMDMYRLPVNFLYTEKQRLCSKCSKKFEEVVKEYNFESIELNDFVDNELTERIEKLILPPEEQWQNILYRGFPVGKMAQYDFALATKSYIYPDLSLEDKAFFSSYIKNISMSIELADRAIKYINPNLILAFNPYGQSLGVQYASNQADIHFFQIQHPSLMGADYSRFLFLKKTHANVIHCQKWGSEKEQPIDGFFVTECWKDTVFRFYDQFSHIFSPRKQGDPNDLFEKLKLDKKKKSIVVYTSSEDERVGFDCIRSIWNECDPPEEVFKNQIEWLKTLKEYATIKKDIQIIVRVHPREGNRQFGFPSKHLLQLQEVFRETTSSFIIIWPDDPVSSYDLLEFADLCLVSWSYMGQEATRVGIPMLSYINNVYYSNDDFMQTAQTVEEYKNKIDAMVNMTFTWKHLLKAIRFYHWRTFIPCIDLGESVPPDFHDPTIWPKVSDLKANLINELLKTDKSIIEYNVDKWKGALSEKMRREESEAMLRSIRLFLDKIFYPAPERETVLFRIKRLLYSKLTGKKITISKKPFVDYALRYSGDISKMKEFIRQTRRNRHLRILTADGMYAILIHKGKVFKRMSPMAIKLAKLHGSEILK